MSDTTDNRPPGRTDQPRPAGSPGGIRHRQSARRAGRPRSTYRTTLYRLRLDTGHENLTAALNRPYLRDKNFTLTSAQIAGAAALEVHGQVAQPVADWCPIVTSLTSTPMAVSHSNAGCALLIAVDDQVYALTYGSIGRFMIDPDRIDPGFGLGFTIRAIEPDQIRRVTRHVLASSGRVERSLVPGGQPIHRYGIEGWGEIVGQLTGKLTNATLAVAHSRKRPVSVAGADSLQVDISTDPERLLADLREIGRVCALEAPAPELEFIGKIQPIRPGERSAQLDERLDDLLGSEGHPDLDLAVPAAQIDHETLAQSYVVRVPHRATRHRDLTLGTILDRTRQRPAGRRLEALKLGSIGMCADQAGREPIAPPTAANKWITAEISDGYTRMIYHEGRWYEIGAAHLDLLHDEINQILNQPSTVVLPKWTSNLADEDAYNRMVAGLGTGYVLLDKHLIRTALHTRGRGIEACDLLGPNNELIHVKRADSSAPLSHLFAQGEVSADALISYPEARDQLVAYVHTEQPGHPIDPTFRPRKVVYAIALGKGKQLTAQTLFTFAQVALYRSVRKLRTDRIDVEVVGIPT
jgi:uncharacterized protein (TIGR04141 family)